MHDDARGPTASARDKGHGQARAWAMTDVGQRTTDPGLLWAEAEPEPWSEPKPRGRVEPESGPNAKSAEK